MYSQLFSRISVFSLATTCVFEHRRMHFADWSSDEERLTLCEMKLKIFHILSKVSLSVQKDHSTDKDPNDIYNI